MVGLCHRRCGWVGCLGTPQYQYFQVLPLELVIFSGEASSTLLPGDRNRLPALGGDRRGLLNLEQGGFLSPSFRRDPRPSVLHDILRDLEGASQCSVGRRAQSTGRVVLRTQGRLGGLAAL